MSHAADTFALCLMIVGCGGIAAVVILGWIERGRK